MCVNKIKNNFKYFKPAKENYFAYCRHFIGVVLNIYFFKFRTMHLLIKIYFTDV